MNREPRTAVVDESFRRRGEGVDDGVAMLACVIVPDGAAPGAERSLREFVAPGQRRFHWRDESRTSQTSFVRLLATLAEHGVGATVYCQEVESQKKAERARVATLWRLLADLRVAEVDRLIMESREERNDRKDRREIISAQKAGIATHGLVYRHGRPYEEPLLWLPDAIAGAVGEGLVRDDDEFLRMLPEELRVLRWPGDL